MHGTCTSRDIQERARMARQDEARRGEARRDKTRFKCQRFNQVHDTCVGNKMLRTPRKALSRYLPYLQQGLVLALDAQSIPASDVDHTFSRVSVQAGSTVLSSQAALSTCQRPAISHQGKRRDSTPIPTVASGRQLLNSTTSTPALPDPLYSSNFPVST